MASIAALIGAQVVGGIGQGIAGGLLEQRRRHEFDQNFDFKNRQFDWQKDFQNQQLKQQFDLTNRGQNLNFLGGLTSSGFSAGSSLLGSILNYTHAQDQLNYQKELNTQRRADLTNEGLPLSFLHIGGGISRSMLNTSNDATLGRSTNSSFRFADSGPNLNRTFNNPNPPSYAQATRSNLKDPTPEEWEARYS